MIEQAVERAVGDAAVLRGEALRMRTGRRVDPRDRDVWNRRRRPRVRLADVASANQPDVDGQLSALGPKSVLRDSW
jgi:hypothetical protein